MADKIKLENIKEKGFDRTSGKPKTDVTIEYVCSACCHLVESGDAFCWQCGEKLVPSTLVEHYHKGERLTDKEFKKRAGKL